MCVHARCLYTCGVVCTCNRAIFSIYEPVGCRRDPQREATITALKPYTVYEFRVCALTADETSEWSRPVRVITAETAPSAPRNLTVTAQSPGQIEVKWWAPAERNGVLRHYHIVYTLDRQPDNWSNITLIGR